MNHSKDQNTKISNFIENRMTRMGVATHGLAKVRRGPPHAWILCQEFKAMREVVNVAPRLQRSKCLDPIADDIDDFCFSPG